MSTIKVTKHNFESEVKGAKHPVLIDFWAPWCGPCRMLSPIVDQIAAEKQDIKVCKVNIDEEPELAAAFEVASIPTLILMKEGKLINKTIGVRPKQVILEMIK